MLCVDREDFELWWEVLRLYSAEGFSEVDVWGFRTFRLLFHLVSL